MSSKSNVNLTDPMLVRRIGDIRGAIRGVTAVVAITTFVCVVCACNDAMAYGLSASQIQANCNQISNAATTAAQTKNNQDVARASAINSQIQAGQTCMQNIESAIHAAIPAIPGVDTSLSGFLSSVGKQLLNQACNIAVGQINKAGQLINAPITSVTNQVNAAVNSTVGGAVNNAVPGVAVSTPNVVSQSSPSSGGFWSRIAHAMFGN